MNQESAKLKPELQMAYQKGILDVIKLLQESDPGQMAQGYMSQPQPENPNGAFQAGQAVAYTPTMLGAGDDVLKMAMALGAKKGVNPFEVEQGRKAYEMATEEKKHRK